MGHKVGEPCTMAILTHLRANVPSRQIGAKDKMKKSVSAAA